MSESVSLPALGESVTEGTVTRWLKQVGDRVEVDEPLLEVSTDKVDTEIPSPIAGVIEEILVAEDETVEVGAALVRIGDGSGGGDDAAAPAAEEPAPAEPEAPAAPAAEEAPAATPDVPAEAAEQPTATATPEPESAPEQPAAEVPAAGTPTEAPVSEAPSESAPAEDAPSEEVPAEAEAPAAEATPEPTPATEGTAPVPSTELPEEAEAPAPEAAASAAPATEAPAEEASAPEAPAESAAPAAESAPVSSAIPAAEPAASPASSSVHAGYVTPIVRKLANEKGIDLSALVGTGVGGRIRKQDVLAAAGPSAPAAEAPAAEAPGAVSTPSTVEVSPLRGTTVPMSRLRKVISERAVISLQTSAQLTTVVEVDVTRVASFRDKVKADFVAKTGVKLSFLPFFTLAAAEALRSYPIVNATTDGTSISYPDHEHISIAVDTERGLLTPVVRNAGDQNLAQLAADIADLAARTRDNKLKPDELSGGTFTVTNTGSRGALFDTPLVFMPQSAILGTGVVVKRPVVVTEDGQDAIAIRSTVFLALSYDHRIVDGADAARFLTAVKTRLETGDFQANLGI